MWLIVGAMCTTAACVWYPVDGAQHRTEQACMHVISTMRDSTAGFGPYADLMCRPGTAPRRPDGKLIVGKPPRLQDSSLSVPLE